MNRYDWTIILILLGMLSYYLITPLEPAVQPVPTYQRGDMEAPACLTDAECIALDQDYRGYTS